MAAQHSFAQCGTWRSIQRIIVKFTHGPAFFRSGLITLK